MSGPLHLGNGCLLAGGGTTAAREHDIVAGRGRGGGEIIAIDVAVLSPIILTDQCRGAGSGGGGRAALEARRLHPIADEITDGSIRSTASGASERNPGADQGDLAARGTDVRQTPYGGLDGGGCGARTAFNEVVPARWELAN